MKNILLLVVVLSSLAFAQQPASNPESVPAKAAAPEANPKPGPDAGPKKVDKAAAYYHFTMAHMYEEEMAAYGRSDLVSKAIDEYRQAISADPTSEYLSSGLAELYSRTGRIRDAVSEAQDILKRDPQNLEAHRLLGHIYLRSLGDMQGGSGSDNVLKLAIEQYEEIVKLDPRSMDDHMMLGRLYQADNQLQKAEAEEKTAVRLAPDSEDAVLALAMLYNGAAGGTASELATALRFTLPIDRLNAAFDAMELSLTAPPAGGGAFQLSLANSIWTQKGFALQPPFLDALATSYGAGVNTVDFQNDPQAARQDINGWVSGQTHQEIPDLFPEGSIDANSRLVLADAVYFHGDWSIPFDPDSGSGPFHAPAGDVSATLMSSDDNAAVASGAGWSAATLAYKGGTTQMVVIVPDAGTFDAFEQGLTGDQLAAILAAPTTTQGLVMPKFEFRASETLNDVLAALGMPTAFTPAADFSGVDGRQDLQVQTVVHQADIAVDEKGTTAAAATGVSLKLKSLPLRLVVDRPFLFFIVHQPSGAILFAGRVLDPTAG